MLPEAKCPSADRLLLAEELITNRVVRRIQAACIKRGKPKHQALAYQRFIHWVQQPNQVALYTLYAYADFDLPKQFDCLFRYDNPAEFVRVKCELIHRLWEGWHPIDRVEHGHKHLCVFTFADQVPALLQALYQETGQFDAHAPRQLWVGLCNFTDFDAIKIELSKFYPE